MILRIQNIFLCLIILCLATVNSYSLSLPSVISDHMVLQRNSEVSLWGWGKALEPLTIKLSWDTTFKYSMKLNKLGQWKLTVKTNDTAGPHSIRFEGYNTIEVKDILFGEVWLCSGQSNMEWSANMKIENGDEEKAKANYPDIRMFLVPFHTSSSPQEDCKGEWVKCTPETMGNASAVGYFFGRELHQKLNRPVGLIQSAWGGTPAEVWTPSEAIANDYILMKSAQRLRDEPWAAQTTAVNYNGMIYPIVPYRIAGALWYQGETNTANANTYSKLLSTLIQSWRAAWGYEFPFYFVQIAPYNGYGKDNRYGAEVRHQQAKVLDLVDKTDMVVVSDIGNLEDIHPRNKHDVGKRLAAIALNHDYHVYPTNTSSPRYKNHTSIGSEVHITFEGAPNGLVSKGDIVKDFEIQYQNGTWAQAEGAYIKGNGVILKTKQGQNVIAVRFAYTNSALPNLFNTEGLPASCFTTER
jgi:sialate O-acetylesterase